MTPIKIQIRVMILHWNSNMFVNEYSSRTLTFTKCIKVLSINNNIFSTINLTDNLNLCNCSTNKLYQIKKYMATWIFWLCSSGSILEIALDYHDKVNHHDIVNRYYWRQNNQVFQIPPLSPMATKNFANRSPLSIMDRLPMATIANPIAIVANGVFNGDWWYAFNTLLIIAIVATAATDGATVAIIGATVSIVAWALDLDKPKMNLNDITQFREYGTVATMTFEWGFPKAYCH